MHEGKRLPQFSPGFRCSWLDVAIIAIGFFFAWQVLVATSWIGVRLRSHVAGIGAGLVVLVPVLAFFLFCNVFRVARHLELLWAVSYVLLIVPSIWYGTPDWRLSVAIAMCAMVMVIGYQMTRPAYHGVWWEHINPKLPEWWREKQSS